MLLIVLIAPMRSMTLAADRGTRIMAVVISSPKIALTTRLTCIKRATTNATSAFAVSVNTSSQQEVSTIQGGARPA